MSMVDDIALDVLFELPDGVVQYLSADVHVDVHDHLATADVEIDIWCKIHDDNFLMLIWM